MVAQSYDSLNELVSGAIAPPRAELPSQPSTAMIMRCPSTEAALFIMRRRFEPASGGKMRQTPLAGDKNERVFLGLRRYCFRTQAPAAAWQSTIGSMSKRRTAHSREPPSRNLPIKTQALPRPETVATSPVPLPPSRLQVPLSRNRGTRCLPSGSAACFSTKSHFCSRLYSATTCRTSRHEEQGHQFSSPLARKSPGQAKTALSSPPCLLVPPWPEMSPPK